MDFFYEIKSAFDELHKEFSEPVIWRGREYKAILTNGQAGVNFETGGFVPDDNFSIKFLEKELDGERPRVGEIVEIAKTAYRIEWVSSRSGRGMVECFIKAVE